MTAPVDQALCTHPTWLDVSSLKDTKVVLYCQDCEFMVESVQSRGKGVLRAHPVKANPLGLSRFISPTVRCAGPA